MQRSGAGTIYRRTMRLVIPFILFVSFCVAVVAVIVVRNNGRSELVKSQNLQLVSSFAVVNEELADIQSEVLSLAESRAVRAFARDTLITTSTSGTFDDNQTEMLSDFAELIENNLADFLTVRYVTFNGAIWSEANTNADSIVEVNRTLRLNEQASDPFLSETVNILPGQTLVDGIIFRRSSGIAFAERQIPILRSASPVSTESTVFQIAGVVQIDVRATALLRALRVSADSLQAQEAGRRVLIVDAEGNLLYDTDAPETDYISALFNDAPLTLSTRLPELTDDLARNRNGEFVNNLIVSSYALPLSSDASLNWVALAVDNEGFALNNTLIQQVVIFVSAFLPGVILILFVSIILRRTLEPLTTIHGAAMQLVRETNMNPRATLATGELRIIRPDSTLMTPPRAETGIDPARMTDSSQDVSELAKAFQMLSERVTQLQQELEKQQVRFTRNIDVAARVSRETATLYDIDDLLNRAIRQICEEYGFYHAQVFLLDDAGVNAVLVYSYGTRGQQLLERGHKLAVGSDSVIGRVTASNRALVVNDVFNVDPNIPHRVNPLLPDTRAEMAVPLQLGDSVIGALDIQSTTMNAFQPEEVRVFQMIADQIAVAIQNVRLLIQSQERFQQIDTLNRQLTRTAWEETASLIPTSAAYSYDLLNVTPGTTALDSAESTSVPIRIRGEIVGNLDAAPGDGNSFTEADMSLMNAVADRVAVAIENARLFEETQSSLSETFTLYQLSRYLNEATSLEDIIQAIVIAVMPDAVAGQIGIFDEYAADQKPAFMEFSADWKSETNIQREVILNGLELQIAQHEILAGMNATDVVLISDTETDPRLDEVFLALISSAKARAMVFIPFSVRTTWRGIMMMEFPTTRIFTERERRIYSALIDQAGVAIDARMLLQQNQVTLSEIDRLYTASRIINMSQSLPELVRAAINTAGEPGLDFELGAFFGAMDSTGWPTAIRMVARSLNSAIIESNEVWTLPVPLDSPLRRRDPLRVQNLDTSSDSHSGFAQYLRARGNKYATVLPLFSANHPIALFFILGNETRYLSDDEIEVYRALTGQMSTVLQNRRLLEQTERALEETRRLYAASRAITSASNLNDVSNAATIVVIGAMPSVARIMVLFSPEHSANATYLDVVFSHTNPSALIPAEPPLTRITRASAPIAALLQEEDGVALFSDIQTDPREWEAIGTWCARNNTRGLIVTAIQTRQQFYGALVIESEQANTFDEPFANFIQAITDQIAIASESIESFRLAQQQAQRALALAQAGQLAASIGGDFADSISEVFIRVAQPANYDRWLLTLINSDQTHLDKVAQRMPGVTQSGSERPEAYALATDNTPITIAFTQNRTLLVNTPSAFPTLVDSPPAVWNFFGKHLVTPVHLGGRLIGTVMVGRSLEGEDLDDNDEQLIATLAAQIAVAVENRRLFNDAETERERISTVLNTLPAGVLVLEAGTFRVIQYNQQAFALLGQSITTGDAFDANQYHILRSGTNLPYPEAELPFRRVQESGETAFSDDISLLSDDGVETDLLINAAPLYDMDGKMTAIITSFENISNLRSLERQLETNLRETVALYDTARALAEADTMEDVLDEVMKQLREQQPDNALIVMLDADDYGVRIARSMSGTVTTWDLPDDLLNPDTIQFVRDVSDDVMLDDAVRLALLKQNIQAFAVLPMRARRDVPLGWLVLLYERVEEFLPELEQFLLTLNESASVALDNRSLMISTNEALQETGRLYDATAMISRARTISSIAAALQRSIMPLKPDMYAAFIVIDGKLTQIYNEAMDTDPAQFEPLLKRHRLDELPTMLLDDLRELAQPTPFEEDLLTMGNIRAVAILPLEAQDAVNGCLFLGYHFPHRFQQDESRYLSVIADNASVVINNFLLLERQESSLAETSKLYQASRSLGDASTPESILQIVVDYLIVPETSQVFITQLLSPSWDAPGAVARVVATWYPPGEDAVDLAGISLTSDQYPAWRLLASPLRTINDVETDDTIDDLERIGLQSLDLRSLAVLPLRVGARNIGCIVIGSKEPYTYDERDLRVYRSFAEQASLRLEATRSLQQAERRARQLIASSEVGQIAGSLLDINELLPRFVDLIRERFSYDHVQIFLMDEQRDWAILSASTGEPGRQLLSINHKLKKGSQSVIGQVTSVARPTIAADTADASVIHRPNPYLPNTRSEMAIPLLLMGNVIGALDVQSNIPNAFDSDDVTVLTTLAGQIANAIDNAQLYEQARSRANEMSFLFDVTTAVANAENLSSAMSNIADELLDSLTALSVAVYLPERYLDAEEKPFTILYPIALAGSDQPLEEISEIRLDTAQNIIASVATNRRPVILNDVINETMYIPVVSSARSAIVVPLTSGMELVGLIAMESEREGSFNENTLRLLLTLSGTLSAIVQNQLLLEQVQTQNDRLRELDRLKSDFLANMSHELRTPLNSIIGFSRVILKGIDGHLTEMQEQDLTTIYNSGLHLLNLINDILDQAKIAAGKMDMQFDYFDIKPVIDGVRSISIGLVKDKPINIMVEVAPNMPQAFGDEFRTRQVLLNLVSNASKFTREGSINISTYPVRDLESGSTMIRVDVTDTGIGIADKDIPLLFEAFRQVDSSLTRTAGGTGLGLPIAKSLIEMQGGRMLVASTVNVGSTFSLLLPIEQVMELEEETKPSTDQLDKKSTSNRMVTGTLDQVRATSAQRAFDQHDTATDIKRIMTQKRQILIIEDNPDMVDQFRRALLREGFEVFAASIPLEAEAMATGLHPTIIIMDVNFAKGAGWDIAKTLHERDDTMDIPIIVVSLSMEIERAQALGVFKFISRPFLPEEIVEAVHAAEIESRVERVLIIDDQPEHARLIQQLLSEYGQFRVFTARSGMEGIGMVARRRPNLIILDLRMPEMDGFDVVQELRGNPETATIPILIVTAETLTSAERERLLNIAILYKANISTESYRELLDGVNNYLNRN